MNTIERRLYDALGERGFTVYRRGWPDFLVEHPKWHTGMALELKAGVDRLTPEQLAMHEALRRFGVPVSVVRESFVERLCAFSGSRGALPPGEVLTSCHDASEAELRNLAFLVAGATA
jgi:hypothetical protein